MEKQKFVSRRCFIGTAALTAGFTVAGTESVRGEASAGSSQGRLPREVWIATVSQQGLSANTPQQMAQNVLAMMEKSVVYRPDVICLPEVFLSSHLVRQNMSLSEQAEVSGELLKDFMDFAKTNHCYLICPMITREDVKIYNSAVVVDRQGNRVGTYHKIHLPEDELEAGITPGPLLPPVFKTDFGVIGIQICFDCIWNDGWKALRNQGAEIVFWPSAYSGGQVINARAWQNKYVVVASTLERSKICDITGDVVAQTGIWDRNLICAPVNLEKAFLHTWPSVQLFDQIRAKYGRKINIVTYHEEQWSVIESLSPDLCVNDILKEFNIRTFEQLTHDAEVTANQHRIS